MAVRLDHGDDQLSEVHEINVTPFIDVILVLLIIFMVAAPLATVDIAVDLPSSTAEQQPRPDKPLYLTVKPDLTLTIGNDTVPRGAIGSALDMYQLYPGVRTVTVIATDNLGNTGTNQCTFEVHATTLSLSNNIVRAQSEGLIPDPAVFAGLKAKLATAQKHHLAGNHLKEHQLIQSLIAEVIKIRGKQMDAVFADRLIAWANDLIAMGN